MLGLAFSSYTEHFSAAGIRSSLLCVTLIKWRAYGWLEESQKAEWWCSNFRQRDQKPRGKENSFHYFNGNSTVIRKERNEINLGRKGGDLHSFTLLRKLKLLLVSHELERYGSQKLRTPPRTHRITLNFPNSLAAGWPWLHPPLLTSLYSTSSVMNLWWASSVSINHSGQRSGEGTLLVSFKADCTVQSISEHKRTSIKYSLAVVPTRGLPGALGLKDPVGQQDL